VVEADDGWHIPAEAAIVLREGTRASAQSAE
jgi:hypothetical protein